MKVVAIVSSQSRKYLVEVSGPELDQITCPGCNGGIYHVGTEINVDSRYRRVRRMMEGRDMLDSAISQLRGLAGALEPLLPIVTLPDDADDIEGMPNEKLTA